MTFERTMRHIHNFGENKKTLILDIILRNENQLDIELNEYFSRTFPKFSVMNEDPYQLQRETLYLTANMNIPHYND